MELSLLSAKSLESKLSTRVSKWRGKKEIVIGDRRFGCEVVVSGLSLLTVESLEDVLSGDSIYNGSLSRHAFQALLILEIRI
jgi:hypothetical protein